MEKKKQKTDGTSEENAETAIPKKTLIASYGIGALQGSINRVANFLLVVALAHVDASAQYPLVTGGTMIVSTLICCFGSRKPSKKEWLSVALAFVGTLALFVIPI
jgi:drug/metabolite transporter (DMT)-like permease